MKLFTAAVNMKSKELSMEVKEAILRLKKENKSIRQISERLGVASSTVWNILKKVELTGTLSNSYRPGRPRKTSKMDDRKIQSMVKKDPSTTSSQIKDTLAEAGVSLSKSTVKRRLHECKHGAEPLVVLKNRKTRKHKETPEHFWNKIVLSEKNQIELCQNDTDEDRC